MLIAALALPALLHASSGVWQGESKQALSRLLCQQAQICADSQAGGDASTNAAKPVFEIRWRGGRRAFWLFEARRSLDQHESAWEFAIVEILQSDSETICHLRTRAYVGRLRPDPFTERTPMSSDLDCKEWARTQR